MKRQIEAVIFDFDDTLIDWSGVTEGYGSVMGPHLENLRAYLSAQGHLVPDSETFFAVYRQVVREAWEVARRDWTGVNFGRCLRCVFEQIDLNPDEIDLQAAMEAYDWQPAANVVLYNDTLAVLQALRQQEYKLGLVTNSMFPMWMRDVELEAYGLIDFFDARLTSGDVGYIKPHTAIYERILTLLDTPAEQAVFVGDWPGHDIAGANASGLISVLIDPPHLNRELNGVEPDYTINRLSDLLPILTALEVSSQ
ncbi:MAG: HAD family hydrolase [Chloroflexota bacterium]